jgi:hypothetical protein
MFFKACRIIARASENRGKRHDRSAVWTALKPRYYLEVMWLSRLAAMESKAIANGGRP